VTERLYYDDSFLGEFDATVLACEQVPTAGKGSTQFRVILDRTAFYPTSGGQPHDAGFLGSGVVLEVVEDERDEIVHIMDREIAKGPVHGSIVWPRRFDHMQQHTGQHLLSAAFVELLGFQTVSFHLGRDVSTIDLAAPSVSSKQAEEAERLTNEIIFDDRPVTVRYGTAAELAALGIRKQVDPDLAGRAGPDGILRAIEIENFDRQPCGGTHVGRSGQVGVVLLRKIEKQKQNWRVEFVCGHRALVAARADFFGLGDAARQLTCGLPEVPGVLRKVLEERAEMYRTSQKLAGLLVEFEAKEMLAGARVAENGRTRVCIRLIEDADATRLAGLARRLVAEPDVVALLGSTSGLLVCAKSGNVPGEINVLLREALAGLGGKGGGTRDFAQGSLANTGRWEEFCRWMMARLISSGTQAAGR
jgi:alanyl-tRNA synthetase